MIIKLNEVRMAKKYLEDYVIMGRIIELAITGLSRFEYYASIARIVHVLKEEQDNIRSTKNRAESATKQGKN